MSREPADQKWLEEFVGRERGLAGTVHRVRGSDLHLTAALNIPPPVLAAVTVVPRGRGMAGQAQISAQPVQTCNLKDEDSGPVRPLARTVDGRAAIALPVLAQDGAVRAVVGISFGFAGEIAAEAEQVLARAAATLP
jgi:hypothetical protein